MSRTERTKMEIQKSVLMYTNGFALIGQNGDVIIRMNPDEPRLIRSKM